MDDPTPVIDQPESRCCALCGDTAAPYGFGPPGGPVQSAEACGSLTPQAAWYCGQHREEGERAWTARYRPNSSGLGDALL